jgi:nucleoid-associated protein YgaU
MGRYDNLSVEYKNTKGLVYNSILLPYVKQSDSDILIITEEDDRLDLLANQFYGDSQLWWVIATYNNLTDIDIKLEPGLQLRIPNNPAIVTEII